MFDQNDASAQSGLDMSQRQVKTRQSPLPADAAPPVSRQVKRAGARELQKIVKPSQLDSDDMLDQHSVLLGLYRRELDRQYENRRQQEIDEDYYDNIQWDEKDAAELRDRGQIPLVYNVISTALNWVTGTQKRSRMDYKVLPRRKEDGKSAEAKTGLLKYLSDVNRTPFARSKSFEDTAKVGVGWMECGVEDNDTGDPVYSRHESWRYMLWDSTAKEDDITDARYITRTKWVDTDILKAIFPKRGQLIDDSVDITQIYASGVEAEGDEAMDAWEIAAEQSGLLHEPINGVSRPRVRVIEMWFRRPTNHYKMVGGVFGGDIYDFSDAHDREVLSGRAQLVKKPGMRMYVALFTAIGFLFFGASPYRHNRFPFTPIWANRRGRDGMPYGMIRGLRDIQLDVNKRASKALFILSSNKVIMDEDALPDDVTIDEFAEEVARPDGIIRKKKGSEINLEVDRDLADAHLQLLSRSIAMIQQTSGITDELMGRHTNATSGIAIQRRQDQGSTTTTNLFDHMRFAMQVHGEKELSLVEQYYTEAKQFRITSVRGTPAYMQINTGLPKDDITRTKCDFIISEADFHATLRQAAAEQLLQAMQALAPAAPQVALAMIDLIVENMDIPNRDEIVQRIRQATGLPDPDAEHPSPEQVQAAQQKQKQQQMNDAMGQAELATKMANAKLMGAKAQSAIADVTQRQAQIKLLLAQAVDAGADAMQKAIASALQVLGQPDVTTIADHLLTEMGWQGAGDQQQNAAALLAAIDQQRQQPQQPVQQAAPQNGATSPGAANGIGLPPPPPAPPGAMSAPQQQA
jgi:hypothetical protein